MSMFSRKEIERYGAELDKSRTFQYVKIGDYYLCLQQNPAVLIWVLFLKKVIFRAFFKKEIATVTGSAIP